MESNRTGWSEGETERIKYLQAVRTLVPSGDGFSQFKVLLTDLVWVPKCAVTASAHAWANNSCSLASCARSTVQNLSAKGSFVTAWWCSGPGIGHYLNFSLVGAGFRTVVLLMVSLAMPLTRELKDRTIQSSAYHCIDLWIRFQSEWDRIRSYNSQPSIASWLSLISSSSRIVWNLSSFCSWYEPRASFVWLMELDHHWRFARDRSQ
jgi:hypothetical protein